MTQVARRRAFFWHPTRGVSRAMRQSTLFQTARWRLVAWNVLVMLVILTILEVAVYGFFYRNVYSEVDQQLQNLQSRIQVRLVQNPDPYELPYSPVFDDPTFRILIANPQGQVNVSSQCVQSSTIVVQCAPNWAVPASQEAINIFSRLILNGHTPPPNDIRTTVFEGQRVRVLTFAAFGYGGMSGIIQISRTVEPEQSLLQQLRQLLLTGALLGIFISGVGSLFLASRALIPIRQAFARQRQFTADASHELRTPLALIRANAEMLCRRADLLPPQDAELIPEIIAETDHLNKLISNLLTLARADSERVTLPRKPVDLRALVTDVHDDLQRIAEPRGITSRLSVDGPVVVEGDETRLRQLVLILLDNAVKYTDPGGRVDVSLRREDNRARLVISDTGIGIPAKDLPHIFERFYRVDRAREHESGGTGLGLSIARWIVQVHHGTIKAESQPGKGTRFQVDLPAA